MEETIKPAPLMVPVKVAAAMLGVSRSQMYQFLKDGKFTTSDLVKHNRLVPVSQLKAACAAAENKRKENK